MRDVAVLLIHLLTTTVKLLRPGGARSLIAESLLLRQQLLILNRGRVRALNLTPRDRTIAGLCKYRILFSPQRRSVSGPKGPSAELAAPVTPLQLIA